MTPERCPLCGAKVLYHGLASIECAGRGCQNFKEPTNIVEQLKLEFTEDPIDWDWFCLFCHWMGEKTGAAFYPTKGGDAWSALATPSLFSFSIKITDPMLPRIQVVSLLRFYHPWKEHLKEL